MRTRNSWLDLLRHIANLMSVTLHRTPSSKDSDPLDPERLMFKNRDSINASPAQNSRPQDQAVQTSVNENGAVGDRVPSISLPKGGGAIRGIGEKFAANPVTGTGSMTIPIATSLGPMSVIARK